MTTSDATAYWYQCRNCKTLLVTPVRGLYRCNGQGCYSSMRYLYEDTIAPELKGQVVYNPHAFVERLKK